MFGDVFLFSRGCYVFLRCSFYTRAYQMLSWDIHPIHRLAMTVFGSRLGSQWCWFHVGLRVIFIRSCLREAGILEKEQGIR